MQGNDIGGLIKWTRQVQLAAPALELLEADDQKQTVQALISCMVKVLRSWPSRAEPDPDCTTETAPNGAESALEAPADQPCTGNDAKACGQEPFQYFTSVLACLLSSTTPTISLAAYENLLEQLNYCRPKGDEPPTEGSLARVLEAVEQYGEGKAVHRHQSSQLQDALCDPQLIQGILVKGLSNHTVRARAANLLEKCCDVFGHAFVAHLVPWQVVPSSCHPGHGIISWLFHFCHFFAAELSLS